ncbi:hypothetical protein [Pseudomonas sp. FW300-N2A2]|uniref:hypothetical protein n=1 Tax=Pseudomonas sp. FW300-N2A2 TaxID=2751316 RepID=UPI001A9186C3|nr:hypothetical protein [Pseudomonas sp. FW300-N2A2]
MLTLKMMGGEDLADCSTSKSFTLVDLAPGSAIAFGRGPGGTPEISVTSRDGEVEQWAPAGNTYVMQDGKTISTFSYSN